MPTFKVNLIPSSNDIILLVTFFITISHSYITKMNTFFRFEEYYEEDQQVLNKPLSSRIHIIDIKFPKLPSKDLGVKPSLGGKLDSSYGPYRKVLLDHQRRNMILISLIYLSGDRKWNLSSRVQRRGN